MRLCNALVAVLIFSMFGWSQEKPVPAASELGRAVEIFRAETRQLSIRPDSPPKKSSRLSFFRSWHGRLFENFRNDALDAVPHEIVQRGGSNSLLRRNQYGFSLTGPVPLPAGVSHGDTFLSLSYEAVQEHISRTSLRTVATDLERTGDFSATVDQAGQPLPIYDPRSTHLNPEFDPSKPVSHNNVQYLRDQFPGNRIPTARLDPVALKALTFYPSPNANVGPFFSNNYFINSPEENTAGGMITKVDHSIADRHRLGLQLAFSNGLLGAAHWFPTAANPGPVDRQYKSKRGSLEHVFTISSQTVNSLSFEAQSNSSESGDEYDVEDFSGVLGLRGIGPESFPIFRFGYLGMGHSSPVTRNTHNYYGGRDSFSTRRGKHNLQITGNYHLYQLNTFGPQYPSASFRFSEGLTSLPGVDNTGHPFASFLLGLSEYAERSVVTFPSYFRRTSSGIAVRDRYDITKNLSVSIGLSFDRSTPREEKYDRQSTIDLTAINPENGRPGALIAAGPGLRSFQPAHNRLDPSVSISWSPGSDSRTVVRAAFSRSYQAIPIQEGQWGTQGFNEYPTYISQNVQLQPAAVLAQGLPPLDKALPDLRPDAANNTVADLMDRSDRQPVYQSASLSIERELAGATILTAAVSYAGGRNLLIGDRAANPNAIPLDALAFRDKLNDEAFNASLRPYPQFKGFDTNGLYPIGRYQRDAGSVRIEKRAAGGLTFSATYVLSKQLDDYSGPYGKQDFFNRQNEWALNPWNPPQTLQASYFYELPLGSNKPFLNVQGWRRYLTDGWSISGVATISSGNPIYPRPQFNNTGGVVQALHVNVVPGVDPHVPSPSPELWFNPSAFDQPADFTIGNAPRTIPGLYNPGNENFDLTVNKRFHLAANRAVEFNAAGFNFLNHANWNDPDNVIGPADAPNVNAGKIIGSTGGRVIQLGLRISF